MDLASALLKEHSRKQTEKIVKYVGNSPERFADLITVFANGPYRITQRAAWPVSICAENHPDLIGKHLKTLLKLAEDASQHDSVKRNVLRLLQFIPIPSGLQGRIAALAFRSLTDRSEAVAIRVFSMTVLANLCEKFPDMRSELILAIEDDLPYTTAAFHSRARHVLRKLRQDDEHISR